MLSQDRTILIVDDSTIILDRLAFILQKIENTGEVCLAQTFDDALKILSTIHIDIALLDIHLQDRSGIDLLRIVRQTYPDIPVIMITNQSSKEVETVCLEIGARYFLDKSRDFTRIPQLIASLS